MEEIDQQIFRSKAILKHNEFRHMHRAPPLKLNEDLCVEATKLAEKCVEMDALRHSRLDEREWNGEPCGESLYMMFQQELSKERIESMGEETTQMWYGTKSNFNWDMSMTNEFTQLVWKETSQIGIGYSLNKTRNKIFVVARYYPRGNMLSKVHENVFFRS